MATARDPLVRSSNTISLVIDGVKIGMAQSISADDDFGLEGASGIGDIHDQEFVPTKATHSLRLSQLIVFKNVLKDKGVLTGNGDDALKGLEFDIQLLDKRDSTLLEQYTGCVYASGSLEVQKHAILSSSISVKARDKQAAAT